MQRTSLQDIADRLGITKPALYYHFASREEFVRSIVQPLVDDGEAFLHCVRERDHSNHSARTRRSRNKRAP